MELMSKQILSSAYISDNCSSIRLDNSVQKGAWIVNETEIIVKLKLSYRHEKNQLLHISRSDIYFSGNEFFYMKFHCDNVIENDEPTRFYQTLLAIAIFLWNGNVSIIISVSEKQTFQMFALCACNLGMFFFCITL